MTTAMRGILCCLSLLYKYAKHFIGILEYYMELYEEADQDRVLDHIRLY